MELSFNIDGIYHATGDAIATIGEEPVAITICAAVATTNRLNTERGQLESRYGKEVGHILPGIVTAAEALLERRRWNC